jgi:hypothetical protein
MVDPYAGWNTYTVPGEKFVVRYPPSFKLAQAGGVPSPDVLANFSLSKSDEFTIQFMVDPDDGYDPGPDATVLKSQALSILGHRVSLDYLHFAGDGDASAITSATINQGNNTCPYCVDGRLQGNSPKNTDWISIYMEYENPATGAAINHNLSELESSQDMHQAIQILDSLHY